MNINKWSKEKKLLQLWWICNDFYHHIIIIINEWWMDGWNGDVYVQYVVYKAWDYYYWGNFIANKHLRDWRNAEKKILNWNLEWNRIIKMWDDEEKKK